MAKHPLLIFPEPAPAERTRRRGGGGKLRLPGAGQQAGRLAPQFQRLQEAMDRQRLALQGNTLGLQPEQALVIETIGPVQNFVNAVKKVEGLEWLGELELDDLAPDHGFQDERDSEKKLKGQLFLVMTDQRALTEIQHLFGNWQQNPGINFPSGLAPLKHAFSHLDTIRPWSAHDRIRDTGILEDWQSRREWGQDIVPFEAELWFRGMTERRQQAETYLRNVVGELGGQVLQQCVIPEIAYHGLLGSIPVNAVDAIVAQRDIKLLQCEDVMYLRPVGQCAIRALDDASEAEVVQVAKRALPQGDPLVALFDGLPLAGHWLLDGRLIIDDPDGYERAYQARERVHGTAMASVICHGDLSENVESTMRPVYVRPIMQPRRGFDGQFFEGIPDGVLPVDLVHRAVRRLFEMEGGEPPAAPSVRVINLSVCDRAHPFDRGMSSWARLLDWLSWKYNVLFVVSAGNHSHDIALDVPRANFQKLTQEQRQRTIIEAIASDTRHRRLLSPAETLNGITLGAAHADGSSPSVNPNLINPFIGPEVPSTVSAHGPGYRRTIKPDMLLPGGRQLLSEKLGNAHHNAILQTTRFNGPPGQRVATPGPSGELDRAIFTRGTSNAAALASRWAVSVIDILDQLRAQPGVILPAEYDVVLLKSLLVHGADSSEAGSLYESILKNSQNGRTFKDYVGRFFGYGATNVAKVLACTDQRVTVLGIGALEDGEGHEFRFPLPPSLSAVTHRRRLTISLAWLTPVNSMRQDYRIAHLWFCPPNTLTPDRVGADWRAVQRGTLQHEVLDGDKAVDFQDGENLLIKVNCRADAGDIPEPIRYGLAVTLEVAEGVAIPIYQEVKDRLAIRVPIVGTGNNP